MAWQNRVIDKLTKAKIFIQIELLGAKIRATVDEDRFLDVYFDPTTSSYSYAFIDLTLPFSGDQRAFGWDDYPHESAPKIRKLRSYPRHFQQRTSQSKPEWIFTESPLRGRVDKEIPIVIQEIKRYTRKKNT